jgi:hypothetical protein
MTTLKTLTIFKNFFNSTLVTPAKNKSWNGSFRLSGSIQLKTVLDNRKSYFTASTNSDLTSDKLASKTSSLIHNFIHGSPELKEEERQTHSKLIARGKYVHEIQSIYSFSKFLKRIILRT